MCCLFTYLSVDTGLLSPSGCWDSCCGERGDLFESLLSLLSGANPDMRLLKAGIFSSSFIEIRTIKCADLNVSLSEFKGGSFRLQACPPQATRGAVGLGPASALPPQPPSGLTQMTTPLPRHLFR